MAEIFKSYDIRGVYPTELTEDTAYRVGKAFVKYLGAKNVVVGRDMRISSPVLFAALARGITEMECDVVDIGMCSTPMLYFAIAHLKLDGGIMVTASHNPGKYNGLKICREQAIPIGSESGLLDIKKLALENISGSRKGIVVTKDIFEDYACHVLSLVDKTKIKGKHIVVDCGNGMAGVTEVRVLEKLGCSMTVLEREPDGNFPNHEPNPVVEANIADLKSEVLKQKADIGIAFDGDCDRAVFVDDRGLTVDGSMSAALISPYLLKKNPGARIIYTPIQSRILKETIEKHKGVPVLHRVGHAFIKHTMRSDNVIFGSEKSGHFYWKDNFNADSSVITALKMLEILCLENKPLSLLLKPLRFYATSDEINFEVEDKDEMIKTLEETYKAHAKTVHYVDGLTIDFGDWWFNVRKSGTEPLLRLNVEAKDEKVLKEKVRELSSIITS